MFLRVRLGENGFRGRPAERGRNARMIAHGLAPPLLMGCCMKLFLVWIALGLLLLALGRLRGYEQNASRRAIAVPTRLSGVDAPEVRPTTTERSRGNQPVVVTSAFDPIGR
jgi:hypothetical protein